MSTWTDSWIPTARVMTLRSCEAWACSRVSVPAFSCAAMRVWSSVSRCAWPPRSRYTRLSPTWPTMALVPARTRHTTVVPMPRLLGSAAASRYSSAQARWMAVSTRAAAAARASDVLAWPRS